MKLAFQQQQPFGIRRFDENTKIKISNNKINYRRVTSI